MMTLSNSNNKPKVDESVYSVAVIGHWGFLFNYISEAQENK